MSQWIERVEGHQVFKEILEFETVLTAVQPESLQEPQLVEHWSRVRDVLSYVGAVLKHVNPVLVATDVLSQISSTLQQARAEVGNYSANKNIGHWNNAQTYLDRCLVHVAALPLQTPFSFDSMREAASRYLTTVSSALDAFRQEGEGISKMHKDLTARLDETSAEVSSQKQRLDTAIATFQQQFSDDQQSRQKEFLAAEQARMSAALTSEETRREDFNEAESSRAKDEKTSKEAREAAYNDLVSAVKKGADELVAGLEENKKHVQKLVGIISDTGMAHGFQKTADEERREAKVWKIVAASSMVVWIIAGLIFFALTYDKELTLTAVARQFLISTPFILLAGFSAMQASRHQRSERQMRQAELEIASIDPFLATLTDDARNEVKREFATRYFGQRELEAKQEVPSSNLIDLAGTLAKAVQELTKK